MATNNHSGEGSALLFNPRSQGFFPQKLGGPEKAGHVYLGKPLGFAFFVGVGGGGGGGAVR